MIVRTYGAKYDANLSTKEIAARVRAEIKAAVAARKLPRATYSVRSERYAGGSTIHVTVSGAQIGALYRPEFLRHLRDTPHDKTPPGGRYTAEACVLLEALEGMLAAYNCKRSDPVSDVYDVKFHDDVAFDWEWEDERKRVETWLLDAPAPPHEPSANFQDVTSPHAPLTRPTADAPDEWWLDMIALWNGEVTS